METQHISKLLPQAIKGEPQQIESRRLKTGEEHQLQIAIASELICKIHISHLTQVLRLIMLKLGIRANNLPSKEETGVLMDHIITNFGGNRIEEIKLAFDMAMAGKLHIDDINCYENFSCAYFSKIMNAYRFWAADAVRGIVQEEKTPQKIFSQEELEDGFRQDAETQYNRFLKGHELRGLEFNVSILEKDGLLKQGEKVIDFFNRMVEKGQPHIYVQRPY